MTSSVYVRLQTLAEAAAAMRISQPTLGRWLKNGAPCDRLGRNRVRVSVDELRAWLLQREAARVAVGGAT